MDYLIYNSFYFTCCANCKFRFVLTVFNVIGCCVDDPSPPFLCFLCQPNPFVLYISTYDRDCVLYTRTSLNVGSASLRLCENQPPWLLYRIGIHRNPIVMSPLFLHNRFRFVTFTQQLIPDWLSYLDCACVFPPASSFVTYLWTQWILPRITNDLFSHGVCTGCLRIWRVMVMSLCDFMAVSI